MRITPSSALLVASGLVSAVIFLSLDRLGAQGSLPAAILTKGVPVSLMIAWAAQGAHGRYRTGILVGLIFALGGDIALQFSSQTAFLVGLGFFLVAHLCYIVAFTDGRPPLAPARAIPFVVWVGALIGFLWPYLGGMAGPVLVYGAAIAAMMWRAAARVGGPEPRLERLALAGAVCFAASDSLIALNRFHAPLEAARMPIMALYWLGQWGIAASARLRVG